MASLAQGKLRDKLAPKSKGSRNLRAFGPRVSAGCYMDLGLFEAKGPCHKYTVLYSTQFGQGKLRIGQELDYTFTGLRFYSYIKWSMD